MSSCDTKMVTGMVKHNSTQKIQLWAKRLYFTSTYHLVIILMFVVVKKSNQGRIFKRKVKCYKIHKLEIKLHNGQICQIQGIQIFFYAICKGWGALGPFGYGNVPDLL